MTSPRPIDSAIQGACPRCGTHTLFASFVRFADRCRACGLDYTQFNVGDGPVVFLTLGVGAIVTICAVVLELKVSPPFWVHALLWIPVTLVLIVLALRFAKGLLLALEYRNAAREGKVVERP